MLYSEPGKESVVGEIVRQFKNPWPQPHVVIITLEALQRLPFIENKEDWHLIVDVIPQACSLFDEVVPDTHGIITNHLKLCPFDLKYSSIPGNHTELGKLAENEETRRLRFCSLWHCKPFASKHHGPLTANNF